MEVKDAVWKTKDGRLLAMHEIGDDHLVNIIRFLIKRELDALASGYAAMGWLSGEMAIDAAEAAIDDEMREREAFRRVFEEEATRRGLRW